MIYVTSHPKVCQSTKLLKRAKSNTQRKKGEKTGRTTIYKQDERPNKTKKKKKKQAERVKSQNGGGEDDMNKHPTLKK